MGAETNISWTDASWNPWVGCTKVSPACASCYMFTGQERWGKDPETVTRTSESNWRKPYAWTGRKIFTCSFSDFFHEDADGWRDEAWAVIRDNPQHTWQILTKRPEAMVGRMPSDWGDGWPNVWLGVSVENPAFYWRIDALFRVPSQVYWISAEPLLKPLDLTGYLPRLNMCQTDLRDPATIVAFQGLIRGVRQDRKTRWLDWVVVGGESMGRPGHPARRTELEWVRSLQLQCASASVPFFLKQLGTRWKKGSGAKDMKGADPSEWPEDLRVMQLPVFEPEVALT